MFSYCLLVFPQKLRQTRLFLFSEPPFQVFFSAFVVFFFLGFLARSKLLSEFHELLLRHRQSTALADIMLGRDHVLHFATTFWTIRHRVTPCLGVKSTMQIIEKYVLVNSASLLIAYPSSEPAEAQICTRAIQQR